MQSKRTAETLMKRSRTVTAVLHLVPLLLGAAATVHGQEAPPPLRLSLQDTIRQVVEKNLDVKVELFNSAVAEADIRRNLGIYDPVLSAQGGYQRSENPSASTVFFGVPRQDVINLDAGVTQLLPTGASVGVTSNNSWNRIGGLSSTSSSMDQYFQSDVLLNLSQPLFKNFGREVTELNINVARFTKEESLDRFKTLLTDTVAQARSDYFKLYSLAEDLEVKKTSLALSTRILEETRARVKAGVLPAMEILNAEFSRASREKDVIDAQRALKDQMDVLRYTMQMQAANDLVTVDPPTRDELLVNEDQALAHAMQARPELAAQRVAIRINDLQQRVARRRTQADVNLNASVGLAGLDRHLGRELRNLGSVDHPSWAVGVQVSYPLGNRAAENEHIRTKLVLEQSQTQLKNQESSIGNQVRAAIRALRASHKQIEVTDRGRAFAEERLRSFIKKNSVGLATTKDVFDVENDLVTAKGNQIKALVDYNNAITQLWRTTGELLEREGIKLTGKEADPLYEKAK